MRPKQPLTRLGGARVRSCIARAVWRSRIKSSCVYACCLAAFSDSTQTLLKADGFSPLCVGEARPELARASAKSRSRRGSIAFQVSGYVKGECRHYEALPYARYGIPCSRSTRKRLSLGMQSKPSQNLQSLCRVVSAIIYIAQWCYVRQMFGQGSPFLPSSQTVTFELLVDCLW